MHRILKTKPVLLALVLLSTPLVVRVLANTGGEAGEAGSGGNNPVTVLAPSDVEVALIRSGLDPDALTAAVVSAGSTSTVVSDFETAMVAEASRLATADTARAVAQVESDRLRRLIRSGRSSSQDVTNYQSEMVKLGLAEADRQSALDDWFAAGTASLTTAQVATLQTIRGNRHWNLEIEYLTADRTEAEWVQLREALTNERVSAKYNETIDPGCQSLISSCNTNATVAAAIVSLGQNQAAVTAAWKSAIQ